MARIANYTDPSITRLDRLAVGKTNRTAAKAALDLVPYALTTLAAGTVAPVAGATPVSGLYTYTFTLTGLLTTDIIFVGLTAACAVSTAGASSGTNHWDVSARCDTADTLKVFIQQLGTGVGTDPATDLASLTYLIIR